MPGDARERRTAGDLAKEIVNQAGEVIAGEAALAKEDVRHAIGEATASMAALGTAGILGFVGLELLVASLAIASRERPGRLAAIGVGMIAAAGVGAVVGVLGMPERPLVRTKERIASDLGEIKDELEDRVRAARA